MDILRYAISKPVTVAVGMLLVALFGAIGLIRLPVQLAPDTELPRIEIYTIWPGASPSEIETEVVEKQEDKLKSIQDLRKMESSSYNDFAQITLTFGLGTDINTAVQRVSNKLDEVWDYPDDVKKPIINTSGANARPTIILTLKMRSGDPREVTRYQSFFENEIQQYIERVDGVASVSAIGTFLFLWLLDRNINVVSLAGISFAVGMLVDNSIVVLENIDRHRRLGKPIAKASYEGTKEVYGAVIASTLTTVAVFLPVIFMREEAGQLFKDIAIAITAAILLSLLVSVTMIPTAMNLVYGRKEIRKNNEGRLDRMGGALVHSITAISAVFRKTIPARLACVIGFTSAASLIAWVLMPKAEYLPQGNQNIIMSILVPPPGYSEIKRREIGDYIYNQVKPYREVDGKDGIPQVDNTFYVNADMFAFVGSTCTEANETRARELIPLMNRIINSLPDMFGVSVQPGIFQTDLGQGRTVDVNVSGDDLSRIIQIAGMLFGSLSEAVPGAQIRPVPSLEMTYPEVNIIPDKRKMAASGLNETDLGNYVAVMSEGKIIGEYRPQGGYHVNLVVRAPENAYQTPEEILNAMITNNHGRLIRIGDVARIEYGQGMTQIARLEKRRNIRLEVTPPDDLPLQAAIENIDGLIGDLREKGMLAGISVSTGGNADKLTETFDALKWNFVLAVIIIYLLMSALFENFLYPFIILFAVPLAAAGGFVGLWIVNATIAPQPLDVLTMLGFIILVGSVVNNAILIVHQSLNNVRYEAMAGLAAISEAVRTRIRPIFMSAGTTILALSPMVLSTGSGSEMYRGIGSVLLGGLAMSTIFTLLVIPALLAFFIGFEKPKEVDAAG